jgi:DNA-binding transcriptional ArsR family regulator
MISVVPALAALAHQGRLTIFRELVKAGPEGLAAGEVSRRVGIAPNTLSASFAILAHAGLVNRIRAGRFIIYRAAFDRMAKLLEFLVEDCCQGRPEVCAPLMAATARATCRA